VTSLIGPPRQSSQWLARHALPLLQVAPTLHDHQFVLRDLAPEIVQAVSGYSSPHWDKY
jgi:hypothetical protein